MTDTSLIVSGASFTLDMEVDRSASSWSATLDIDGVAAGSLGPLALSSVSPGVDAIETSMTLNALLGATAVTDIEAFEIYSAAPTPAPLELTVDTLADEMDSLVGDGVCATLGGECSLRAALAETNAAPTDDTIILPDGLYLLDGFTTALEISDDVRIEGTSRAATILDGNGTHRVFEIGPGASDVTVEILDLTIRNGIADASTSRRGGAIESYGDLTLTRCHVTGNHARQGGGLMNFGRLELNDCLIEGNSISEFMGGIALLAGIASRSRRSACSGSKV